MDIWLSINNCTKKVAIQHGYKDLLDHDEYHTQVIDSIGNRLRVTYLEYAKTVGAVRKTSNRQREITVH
jgi:hypothetical protein